MASCEVFIFLDDVQFKKNEWQNRNRIRTPQGEQYLTVPVLHKFPQTIRKTLIDARQGWVKKHLHGLELNYGRAPFFKRYFDPLRDTLARTYTNLAELNVEVTLKLAGLLSLRCRTLLSSDLRADGAATERLINLCRKAGADTYLSGIGGKEYLDEEAFKRNGIQLRYQDFHSPVYPQAGEPFIPNLSVVDLLFNCGDRSLGVLVEGLKA